MAHSSTYFTNYTRSKGIIYSATFLFVVVCSLASLFQPFIPLPCHADDNSHPILPSSYQQLATGFENPGFIQDVCYRRRYLRLCFLSPYECSFGRRILYSVLFGSIIGWERRQADRPAGIRTMSLVSLGSCLFTITSAFAFVSGPMNWDGSRVAAAIPSGVGFLGAGLIYKQAEKEENGESTHSVHGLTTAASVWLSAAVGIACGGEMYFCASFSVGVLLLLLRFGPRPISSQTDTGPNNNVIAGPASSFYDKSMDLENQRLLDKDGNASSTNDDYVPTPLTRRISMRPQLV